MAFIHYRLGTSSELVYPFRQPDAETLAKVESLYPLSPDVDSLVATFANWNAAEYALWPNRRNEINTWYRPGASACRWGLFRGLITAEDYDRIFENGYDPIIYLQLSNDNTIIEERMYVVKCHEVNGTDLYLLTLADRRWKDASVRCGEPNWGTGYSWVNYLDDVLSGTGINYSFEVGVESAFGWPDPDSLLSNLRSPTAILDAVAWNTGRVVT